EIRRNAKPTKHYPGGYKPVRAHQLAARRRRWDARFKMQRQPVLRRLVEQRLAMGWSPQQIAGRLALMNAHMRISHESIYRYIYHRVAQKDWLHRLLPQRKNRRGRLQRGGLGSVEFIKHRKTLEDRPNAAETRIQPGHWEADLMAFSKYGQYLLVLHLLVLHERTSRILRVVALENKKAAHVAQSIASVLQSLPSHLRRTITFDNGTEFAHHFRLGAKIGIATFFCDTHAPWQKGGVENAIGRLRRPLPRKSDLATICAKKMKAIVKAYNHTPRKCLNYQTPAEVFNSVALQP
ncbi:MAG: IS30 family transposase, partial [Alphaproteobacteria bacterium]|nr:IS30 family transposase [Alphaproteobacteria bacterium]